jgi:hypothetical protein
LQVSTDQLFTLIPNQLTPSVGSPEKAGVGGSIPSLATTFKPPAQSPAALSGNLREADQVMPAALKRPIVGGSIPSLATTFRSPAQSPAVLSGNLREAHQVKPAALKRPVVGGSIPSLATTF